MRNNYRLALAMVGLLVGMGASIGAGSGTALAQGAVAQSTSGVSADKVVVTFKKNQLVFIVGRATTTITADRIVRHGKEYTLRGNFRMVIPQGQVYEGKDAEVSLWDGEHGDGSPSRMLEISTSKSLSIMEPVKPTKEKPGLLSRSLNKDGEPVKVSLHLHPVTFYANVGNVANVPKTNQ